MRSLTPIQAAVAVAIGGAVAVSMVPAFFRNLQASRLAEPLDGLQRIATRATALAAGQTPESAYPDSVGLTPAQVPRGERVVDPAGTWQHPTWARLSFSFDTPHSFSFAFDSTNASAAAPGGAEPPKEKVGKATFRARAHGDLDGDGSLSTFEVTGELSEGAEPVTSSIIVYREVE
jgi:hypothetical protein